MSALYDTSSLLMEQAIAAIQAAAPRLKATAEAVSEVAQSAAPKAAKKAAPVSKATSKATPKSTTELLTAEAYRENGKAYRTAHYHASNRFRQEYSGNKEDLEMVLGSSDPRGGGVPVNLNTADDFFGYMEEVAREVGGGNIYRRSSVDASNPRLQRAMEEGLAFEERPAVNAGTAQGRLGIVDVLSSKAAFDALEENEKRQAMVLREAFGEAAEGTENAELRQLAMNEVMGEESSYIRGALGNENLSDSERLYIRKLEADMLDQKLGMTYENEAGEIVQNPYAVENAAIKLKLESHPNPNPNKMLGLDESVEAPIVYPDNAAGKREIHRGAGRKLPEEEFVPAPAPENLGFIGRYAPQDESAMVESAIPGLGRIEAGGAMGMLQTAMLGGAMGGALSVATDGEFGEGAVAGGIAGLGIRGVVGAIRANGAGLERAMYKNVLGEGFNEGMTQAERVAALRATNNDNLGFVQSQAKSMLLSDRPSMTQQSRGAIMGGAALSGMMFTSNKKDRRRGFNKHRGNRI